MRWRELWDDLRGRGSRQLREPLVAQMQAGVDIADRLLAAIAEGSLATIDVDAVQAIEERADAARDEFLLRLSRLLTTPIDREDLFRLSRSVDDVVDNLRDFAREVAQYGVHDESLFSGPVGALRTGCTSLGGALAQLDTDPEKLAVLAREAKHDNATRRAYHEQMARLLSGDLDMHTLRDRELLRRLDVAGLRLGEAADVLAGGALKRR